MSKFLIDGTKILPSVPKVAFVIGGPQILSPPGGQGNRIWI